LNEFSGVDDESLYTNGSEVGRDPNVTKGLTETSREDDESLNVNGVGVDWDSMVNVEGVEWE